MARALLSLPSVSCVRLFTRRPIELAKWDPVAEKYGAWGFRGLKGAAAELAIQTGIVGIAPPNGPLDGEPRLELWDVDSLLSDASGAASGLGAVIYALGYDPAPLPEIIATDGSVAVVTGCGSHSGRLSNIIQHKTL